MRRREKPPLTSERIERTYRREMTFIRCYQAFLAIYSGFIVGVVVLGAGQPWLLLYLLLNAAWWWLSTTWVKSARDVREIRYRTLRTLAEIDEMKRRWAL